MTNTHPAVVATAGATLCLVLAACSTGSPTNHARASGHSESSTTTAARGPASTTGTSPAPSDAAATPQPAATVGDACSLVSRSDVTSSTGTDLGQGTPDSSHGATQCSYGTYQNEVLLVNVLPEQGQASYDHARQNPRLLDITGASIANLTGLGDKAFELSAPHTDAIYLTKGDLMILVGFTSRSTPRPGVALALAKIAARRL